MWRAHAGILLAFLSSCRFDADGLAGSPQDAVVEEGAIDTGASVVPLPSTPDADAEADVEVEAGIDCSEPGAVLANGHCYFTLSGTYDWYMSRDECAARAAHLVTIVDAAEHALVKSLADGDRWLGLRKAGDAGVFAWITGEPFALDAFAEGEPNGTGSCGKTAPDGEWRDYSCLDALPAICERD